MIISRDPRDVQIALRQIQGKKRSTVSAVPLLVEQCRLAGLPAPETELRFHPSRKWRFDLAWPALKIAVEVEGGVFIQGRHSRGAGLEADAEKYAEAAIHGWTVLRVTPRQVKNGQALKWISELANRED